MTTNSHTCDDYTDHLAELALGTLSGRDRAETLSHVDNCTRCSAEVEDLSRTADDLLHVAPETEPPLGFEVRLFEQLGFDPSSHATGGRRLRARQALARHSRALLLGAAAASVAIAGTGIGLAATGGSPAKQSATPRVTQATLLDVHGHNIGRVVASPGKPPWIFMYIESTEVSGHVTCELVLANGHTVKLGAFLVHGGYGTWAAPIAVPISQLRRAQLLSGTGAVVAAATFPV